MKVTLKSLAAELGVDSSLVSRVLRGDSQVRVSAEKRELILSTAQKRGYRPNRVARSLKARTTQVIALLTPDVTNPFHSLIFRGVEKVAQAAGYSVILCNTPDIADGYEHTLDLLTQGLVDGVLVASARLPDPRLEELRRLRIPFLVLNRPSDSPNDSWVGPDDFQTGYLGSQYLLERHHTRLALLLGDPGLGNMQKRERGFLAALEANSTQSNSSSANHFQFTIDGRTVQLEVIRHLATRSQGVQAALKIFAQHPNTRPQAIFAPHTLLTEALIEASIRTGVRIPNTIDVLGYSAQLQPILPSVYVPAEEMGVQAMTLFLEVLQNPEGRGEPIHQKIASRIVMPSPA